MKCQFYFGAAERNCQSEGTVEVSHKRPRNPFANPYRGKNTDMTSGNGEVIKEVYCIEHAHEVEEYWRLIQN